MVEVELGDISVEVEVLLSDEDINIYNLDPTSWANLALKVLVSEEVQRGKLNIRFVESAEIAELNVEHLGKQGPTDVLSFPLDVDLQYDPEFAAAGIPLLLGDVVVCPEIAAKQAAEHGWGIDEELSLLLIHGVLHVLGHTHDDVDDTEVMRAKERLYLDTIGITHIADGAAAELLSDFDYDLPPEAIAQTPAIPRESAKMLTYLGEEVGHQHVFDLPNLCQPGDLLVLNETRVRHARLMLQKETGGSAEVLLLEMTGKDAEWKALVKPSKKIKPGSVLMLNQEPVIEVNELVPDGTRIVKVLNQALVDTSGRVPLPPYIRTELEDPERYQTVYANRIGSAAAPTAGLHLSESLLKELEIKGVGVAKVDLQIGLATFKPIAAEKIADHQMHEEHYSISDETWQSILNAQRVVAVGTTVVRTLESAAASGVLEGRTDLFIRRGYKWRVVDRLLTNFHVPKSSLLVLVDAFVGPVWKDLYQQALADDYRFLSFGDCMLLDRWN